MAFREGMKKAGVQLLEPIMKVRGSACIPLHSPVL